MRHYSNAQKKDLEELSGIYVRTRLAFNISSENWFKEQVSKDKYKERWSEKRINQIIDKGIWTRYINQARIKWLSKE